MIRSTQTKMPPLKRHKDYERTLRQVGFLGRAFQMGDCIVLVDEEPIGWHLSISCEDRYPTWDEIAEARYALLPDAVDVVMHLPPKAEYVNIHPFCFHLHEHPEREVFTVLKGPQKEAGQ